MLLPPRSAPAAAPPEAHTLGFKAHCCSPPTSSSLASVGLPAAAAVVGGARSEGHARTRTPTPRAPYTASPLATLSCTLGLPAVAGVGSSLQRHPFSGLLDSAGELLPLADSDFHGHHPATFLKYGDPLFEKCCEGKIKHM